MNGSIPVIGAYGGTWRAVLAKNWGRRIGGSLAIPAVFRQRGPNTEATKKGDQNDQALEAGAMAVSSGPTLD